MQSRPEFTTRGQLGLGNGNNNWHIKVSARLIERILLGFLVLAVGGNTAGGLVERGNLKGDVNEVCDEVQGLRDELALLFEPFLDSPSEDRAGRAALMRVIERLRAPHRCP